MSAIGCYYALAAAGLSPPAASLGVRRGHAAAAASFPMSTTAGSHRRRRRLVSRAAINIPPDALVNPSRKHEEAQNQWGIDVGGDNVKLWFLITGIAEGSNVEDEIEAKVPPSSNVLTIKRKTNESTKADELDVRLLLTENYDTQKISKVLKESSPDEDKVRLAVTIGIKKTT